MNLDSEDLVNQFRQDWPLEAEVSTLRCLTQKQAAEIDRLTALQAGTTYSASSVRPYVGDGTAVDLAAHRG